MNSRLLDLVYRSFDSELSAAEQAELERALSSTPELQKEKERIENLRNMVSENTERSFKPFFSARVMHRLKSESSEQEDFTGSLFWAFRRVALIGAIAILLLIANHVFIGEAKSMDDLLAMPTLSLEETWRLDIGVE